MGDRFLGPVDLSLCVTPIQRLVLSAWIEHTPFALFLTQALRPHLVVELGTHTGASYCAFCQAIDALRLPARAYGIDTWQGDSHTGAYDGRPMLAELKAYHDPRYSSFSTLLESTFDAALPRFQDGTIDLLHIDGCHTYEAVSHDFYTWMPKVSQRGVVLFHDTHVRDQATFGVWRFWEELQGRYRTFEFPHGFGLGVLAAGPELAPALEAMLAMDHDARVPFQEFFHCLGRRVEADRQSQGQMEKRLVAKQREVDCLKLTHQQEIAALKGSRTYRVGRFATSPVRLLRRLAG